MIMITNKLKAHTFSLLLLLLCLNTHLLLISMDSNFCCVPGHIDPAIKEQLSREPKKEEDLSNTIHQAVQDHDHNSLKDIVDLPYDTAIFTQQLNGYNEAGHTPLTLALTQPLVDEALMKIIELLISQETIDPNKTNKFTGASPLHYTVLKNNPRALELLLLKDADPNIYDGSGSTPFTLAVHHNSIDMVTTFLLNSKTDANFIDKKTGLTPLQLATKQNNPELAQKIIKRKVNISDPGNDPDGNTPLHYAAQVGSYDIASRLLANGAKIDEVNKFGMTPLDTAIEHSTMHTDKEKREPILNYLLSNGANISHKDKYGTTPLHRAVKKQDYFLVLFLLQHQKTDAIDNTDQEGKTPLHCALQQSRLEDSKEKLEAEQQKIEESRKIAHLLLQRNANIVIPDNEGITPLHYALKSKQRTLIQEIITRSTPDTVNLVNNYEESPLLWAFYYIPDYDIIKLLIDKGAQTNKTDKQGITPLHLAVLLNNDNNDKEKLLQLLIDHNADSNVTLKTGKPPLFSAIMKKDYKMVEFLLKKARADPNYRTVDQQGKSSTPLEVAISLHEQDNSMEDIICLLIRWGATITQLSEVTTILTGKGAPSGQIFWPSPHQDRDYSFNDNYKKATYFLLTKHHEKFKNTLLSIDQAAILSDGWLFLMAVGQGNITAVKTLLNSPLLRHHISSEMLDDALSIIKSIITHSDKKSSWLSYGSQVPTYKSIEAIIKEALTQPIDLNSEHAQTRIDLLRNIQERKSDQVKQLLDEARKRDPHYSTFTTKYGDTPLHYALEDSPDLTIILLLLEHGAQQSLTVQNHEGTTPLHKAVLSLTKLNKKLVEQVNKIYPQRETHQIAIGSCIQQLKNARDIMILLLQYDTNPESSLLDIANHELTSPRSLIAGINDFIINEIIRQYSSSPINYPQEIKPDYITEDTYQYLMEQLFSKNSEKIIIKISAITAPDTISSSSTVFLSSNNPPESSYQELNQERSVEAGVVINKKQTQKTAALPELPEKERKFHELVDTVIEKNLQKQTIVSPSEIDSRNKEIEALIREVIYTLNPILGDSADINGYDTKGNLALSKAINNNYKELFDILLTSKPDQPDQFMKTALHYAALQTDDHFVTQLLEHKAQIAPQDQYGLTPLHYAAMQGNIPTALRIIYTIVSNNKAMLLDAKDHKDNTPLHSAIKNKLPVIAPEKAPTIIDENESVNSTNNEERHSKHFIVLQKSPDAPKENHLGVIKLLLQNGANPNSINKSGASPLHTATENNDYEGAELLLNYRANPNIQDIYGNTPLHYACGQENRELCMLLLKRGALLNTVNTDLESPLFWAITKRNEQLVKLLLERGASVTLVNKKGETPLMRTVLIGNTVLTNQLLLPESEVNRVDNKGNIPLHYACQQANLELVTALLNHHANPNIGNKNGESALLDAISTQNDQILALLLEKKASVNYTTTQGETPLMRAINTRKTKIVLDLLLAGADPNLVQKNCPTALDHALQLINPIPIVRLLLSWGARLSTVQRKQYTDFLEKRINQEQDNNKQTLLRAEHALIIKNRELFQDIINNNPQLPLGLLLHLAVGDRRSNTVPFLLKKYNENQSRVEKSNLTTALLLASSILKRAYHRYYETIYTHLLATYYNDQRLAITVPGTTLPFTGTYYAQRAIHDLLLGVYENNLDQLTRGLNAGADPAMRDQEGNTPLHIALRNEPKLRIIQALLEAIKKQYPGNKRQKINILNNYGNSPLHNALKSILRLNQEVPSVPDTINRALQHNDHKQIIRLLLEAEANPHQLNRAQETPLSLASQDQLLQDIQAILTESNPLLDLDDDLKQFKTIEESKESESEIPSASYSLSISSVSSNISSSSSEFSSFFAHTPPVGNNNFNFTDSSAMAESTEQTFLNQIYQGINSTHSISLQQTIISDPLTDEEIEQRSI